MLRMDEWVGGGRKSGSSGWKESFGGGSLQNCERCMAAMNLILFQGPIIQEVRQEWSPWLYQVTSLSHLVWSEPLYIWNVRVLLTSHSVVHIFHQSISLYKDIPVAIFMYTVGPIPFQ